MYFHFLMVICILNAGIIDRCSGFNSNERYIKMKRCQNIGTVYKVLYTVTTRSKRMCTAICASNDLCTGICVNPSSSESDKIACSLLGMGGNGQDQPMCKIYEMVKKDTPCRAIPFLTGGIIPIHELTASSTWTEDLGWDLSALPITVTDKAWCSHQDKDAGEGAEWILFDLLEKRIVTSVTTKGFFDAGLVDATYFVKTFMLEYSDDGIIWRKYSEQGGFEKIFEANGEPLFTVNNELRLKIYTRYVKIVFVSYYSKRTLQKNYICTHMEIYGCV